MTARTIELYFDYLSPYAYLLWTQIHALADRNGCVVEPVPVLLAGLLDHHGTQGPAEVPAKRVYVFKDCVRTAQRLAVPLSPPPTHPFNPLLALRVSSLDMNRDTRRRLIDGLLREVWGGGRGVESAAVIDEVAAACGITNASERASAADTKARLRTQTERALHQGIFGVPSMVVGGELFWGLDSLANLEAFLGGQRLPDGLLATWAHIRPSAERRR